MPERFCTMYEKCKFRSMGYISAFDKSQCVNMIQRMFVCDLKLQQKNTNNISYTVWYESSVGELFALRADMCNLD